jgi:hypothetical protein
MSTGQPRPELPTAWRRSAWLSRETGDTVGWDCSSDNESTSSPASRGQPCPRCDISSIERRTTRSRMRSNETLPALQTGRQLAPQFLHNLVTSLMRPLPSGPLSETSLDQERFLAASSRLDRALGTSRPTPATNRHTVASTACPRLPFYRPICWSIDWSPFLTSALVRAVAAVYWVRHLPPQCLWAGHTVQPVAQG